MELVLLIDQIQPHLAAMKHNQTNGKDSNLSWLFANTGAVGWQKRSTVGDEHSEHLQHADDQRQSSRCAAQVGYTWDEEDVHVRVTLVHGPLCRVFRCQ